jgi:DNA-binding transcriptional LysR family regulator
VTYEWLFSFAVFAEKCNFTHAAVQLHISQPALHVQIKKLTEQVGVPLYLRSGRTLRLTPEGERLAAFARSVQEEEAGVLARLRGETYSGPVVLAAGQGAFLYLLGPAVKAFPKKRWPLRLLNMRGPEAIESLRQARAHLAVAVLTSVPEGLEATRLRDVGQHLLMKSNHRLARRRKLSPADLAGEELILAPAGSPHRMMVEQAMRSEGIAPEVSVEASGWELMMDFVSKGMGVAIVNDFCSVPRGLTAVPMRGFPLATYYLLARKTSNEGVLHLRERIVHHAS